MFVLIFLLLIGYSSGLVSSDEVHKLPGFDGKLPSRHFSGYLNITSNKHLHYYLVEQHNSVDPKDETVVFWFNGGPGCSSLDGFFYEHGPFRINETDPSKLMLFDFAWSKLAHMVYLEAPVGVGYSYSDDPNDYITDDDKTAQDNLLAVEKFFDLYPEYRQSKFYLTGESYAGVYVPTLAEQIMKADKAGKYKGPKLLGIGVGNGCAGHDLGPCAGSSGPTEKYLSQYLRATGLISHDLKEKLIKECGDFADQMPEPQGICKDALEEMHYQVGNVNLYNIYGECHNDADISLKAPHNTVFSSSSKDSSTFETFFLRNDKNNLGDDKKKIRGPVACIDSRFASKYVSNPKVVDALHVKQPPYHWATCVNQIKYTSNRKNLPKETYPELVEYLDYTLIFSGDADACVPYTFTDDWTAGMGYPKVGYWHPWIYPAIDGGDQVGGYATNYKTNQNKKFSFVTIKGARHETPETSPEQAYELFRRLITNEPF